MGVLCIEIAGFKAAMLTTQIFVMTARGVTNEVFKTHRREGERFSDKWNWWERRVLLVVYVRLTLLRVPVDLQLPVRGEDDRDFLPVLSRQVSLVL